MTTSLTALPFTAPRTKLARTPGAGWKHYAGSSVYEHTSGLRIHCLGRVRLPNGEGRMWTFDEQFAAMRQQGYNIKRALMVWALTFLPQS